MSDIYKNHQPYTYLIGWSRLNWWYYGVRFAMGCNPSDLWVLYFTSSKEVHKIRTAYGEPDIIQIRKTFDDVEKAKLWETIVLKRMKVAKDPKWLNKHHNKSRPALYGEKHPNWKHKTTIICKTCKKSFEMPPCNSKYQYCSPRCSNDSKIGVKNTIQNEKISKKWSLCDPTGVVFHIKNLRGFCRDNNLDMGAMWWVLKGRYKQHKGWTIACPPLISM